VSSAGAGISSSSGGASNSENCRARSSSTRSMRWRAANRPSLGMGSSERRLRGGGISPPPGLRGAAPPGPRAGPDHECISHGPDIFAREGRHPFVADLLGVLAGGVASRHYGLESVFEFGFGALGGRRRGAVTVAVAVG